ncbi:MAG: DNA translocase FtsK 4TM domain-containing protein [Planctomycetes bacterium]|nr:DNA translocase FtsK 4TM domain-containing protein [Planctomycetota bacterium]
MAKASKQSVESRGPKGSAWRFIRYCMVLLLTGGVVLAWMSLITFSPTDPPSTAIYPVKAHVDNAAGVVGAFFAHSLRYWLGGGVFMGLVALTAWSAGMVFGGIVTHVPWRVVGAAMLIASASTALFLLNPGYEGELAAGKAGVLGAALGQLSTAKFGTAGSWLILILVLCAGIMFTADSLVLRLPALGKKVWQKGQDIHAMIVEAREEAARRRAIEAAQREAMADSIPPGQTVSAPRKMPARQEIQMTPNAQSTVPVQPSRNQYAKAAAQAAPVAASAPVQNRYPAQPARAAMPAAIPLVAKGVSPIRAMGVSTPATAAAPAKPQAASAPAADLAVSQPPRPAEKPQPRPARADAAADDGKETFTLPPIGLLAEPTNGYQQSQEALAQEKAGILQQTLNDFNIQAQVVGHMTGPVITMYELALAAGVKVAAIVNLSQDIARALAVPGVRIVSPLPGKDTVGIEVPNLQREKVRILELMRMNPESKKKMRLPVYLGKDSAGSAIVEDLTGMPHILIAGTTNSGKSVCINSIIMSVLMTRSPQEVRLILVDPKMVEMAAYENIPHLLCPTITDMRKAAGILEWAATKMDERYEILKEAGVKNVAEYNNLSKEELYERFKPENDQEKALVQLKLPYYVIIIDELADLMMSYAEVEEHIIRIAQKARAIGIHLVLATQRPSVDVVTGLIKANMPSRIGFRVAGKNDSRIVLDQNGAEVLLGHGDMLYLKPTASTLLRAQGTFVEDSEIRAIVKEVRKAGDPKFDPELTKMQAAAMGDDAGEKDELFDQAVEIVLANQRGSVSLLQRKMEIGYGRASRIIDQMAEAGILGDYKGSQARECLMTVEDWQTMKASISADRSGASALNGQPTCA